MSHVKNYDVGQIHLDLLHTPAIQSAPYIQYTHELPLLSFGDVQHSVNLSLVFNYERYRDDKATGKNPFLIAPGFKLNLQKRLLYTQFGVFDKYQEESGKIVNLNKFYGNYTFPDDSQRIIRQKAQPGQTGNTSGGNIEMGGDDPVYDYFLEYPDFSKEKYTESGKIVAVYDKYSDNAVLTYSYDANDRLTTIGFRNGKDISLAYDTSNRLQSITYNNQTSTFVYQNGMLNYVEHYTGVKYYYSLSQAGFAAASNLPASNLKVTATATEGNETVSYAKGIALNGNGTTVDLVDYIGNTTVNKVSYKHPKNLIDSIPPFTYVDIIDNNGVETRVQIHDGKIMYSYEVHDGAPLFEVEDTSSRFIGNIYLYNAAGASANCTASGAQSPTDGMRMYYNDMDKQWKRTITDDSYGAGYYTLSGWIKANEDNVPSDVIHIISSSVNDICHMNIDLEAKDQWKYFSCLFYAPTSILYVYNTRVDHTTMCDLKLTFEMPDDESHTTISNCVLLKGNDILSFQDVHFHDQSEGGRTLNNTDDRFVTFSDVLRFLLRQMKSNALDEIYYNNCQGIFTGANGLWVSHVNSDDNDEDNSTPPPRYTISDYDLGVRSCFKNKESLTRYHIYEVSEEDGTVHCYINKTCTINGTLVSSEKLDDNLDIVESTVDGITTKYVRDTQGRITEESVAGLYKRATTYTDTFITVKNANPSTGATISSVKYYINPTWGVVTKVEMLDANDRAVSSTTNTYDDAMSTITSKGFDNMLIRRNEFQYAKGRLSSVTGGSLTYSLEYADATGDLTGISKNSAVIETHSHSQEDGVTTVTSSYPSSEGALHTENKVFDQYGRLASVEGVLENQYRIAPQWTYRYGNEDKHTMEDYDKAVHGALETHGCAKVGDTEIDGKDASLSQVTDQLTLEKTRYGYDKGLLTAAVTRTMSELFVRQETFVYDKIGRLTKDRFDYYSAGNSFVTGVIEYERGETHPLADSRVRNYTYLTNGAETAKTRNYYDNYKRVSSKLYTIGGKTFTKSIGYLRDQISSISDMTTGDTTTYQYDEFGRITSSSTNGTTITYKYNSYGQLTRENNKVLDKTFVYQYNNNSCITKVKEYAYATGTPTGTAVETAFTYDSAHPDRLTACGGTTVSYNSMGCPTTVNGYSATWTRGKLARLSKGVKLTGMHTYNYSYNAFGQRIGSSYSYTTGSTSGSAILGTLTGYNKVFHYDQSGRLICESKTSQYYGELDSSERIVYLYDGSSIIGMQYSGSSAAGTYYFQRNLLGDVVGIYNTAGTKVAEYAYDAWGNCTVTLNTNGIATKNPIRYRGYYYDEETGLYYLNARYYSPAWRRFISPDDTGYLDPETPNGLNLYTYCNNDPIKYYDPNGRIAITTLLITAAVSAFVAAGANALGQVVFDGATLTTIDVRKVAIAGISGFASGLIPGSGFFSIAAQAIVGSVVTNGLSTIWLGEDFDIRAVVIDTVVSIGTSYAINGLTHMTSKLTSKIFDKAPNYSQYQHYYRSKGYDYSRQEIYNIIAKHQTSKSVTDAVINNAFSFLFSSLTFPV